ncbi:U7 snRNA-associated Sm-like protein LSm11 [Teleopsis dalmanni]|uniref:U7 snRNA-associated Sm-like protein LSm11 n=1 Tax=Teleopsis dalmanni TaxID=139649 RepID=UPI0018CF862E|nr:U7 snRNA-associated Sm-like protein LSm11 [Teleopsis dalmanni]
MDKDCQPSTSKSITNLNQDETEKKTKAGTVKWQSHEGTGTALDCVGEHFDSKLALYTPEFQVAKKQPKIIFQNFAAYESALTRFGCDNMLKEVKKQQRTIAEKKSKPTKVAVVEAASIERRFEPHQMAIQSTDTRYKRHLRNIYTHMEKLTGPLQRLHTSLSQSREHVKVQVRNEHGVRGHIEGHLKFFDKHWNMLLVDVCVVWQRRKYKYGVNNTMGKSKDCTKELKALGIKLPELKVKSLNRKNVQVTKHCSQILLRGEEIVLVQFINDETEAQETVA